MTTSDRSWGFWLTGASWLAMGCAIAISGDCANAQIAPDTTLGAENSVVTPLAPGETVDVIQGGATRGTNLFHSFEQFSVPTGGTAFFNNAADIQNIISRVTGGSISNIDGLIRANGSANLFLINPNGIIFGPNASLNIGGSFLASTASSLNFADGTQFSATAHPKTPLLTISVPIGLQFGGTGGSIRNQSQVTESYYGYPVGLQVKPGKTLALVGGDVALEGGVLTAEEGRIELGSVGSLSLVSLTPAKQGWALGYEGVQNFQDVRLSPQGFRGSFQGFTGSLVIGDNIQVRGRQVRFTSEPDTLIDSSDIRFTTSLAVTASELVEVSGGSSLSTSIFSSEAAGDLTITTGKLIVRDGSTVSTSTFGGSGGNLTVRAFESVEVIGINEDNYSSSLSTYNSGDESAGDLTIETGRLTVQDRSQIMTNTSGAGNAGDLIIRASDSVKVSGEGGILALTTPGSTGAGGNLTIETKRLEGTQLAVRSFGQGPVGTLTVIAPESLPTVETQIVSDETLPISSTVRSDFNISIIEGGTQVGSNLFHSFAEFSVPTGSGVYFNNALDIRNIISRVTGEPASNIDGFIRANGTANLFLLNPNGIIFGPNASLNISGSFLGSTAFSLNFADGAQFSATAHPKTPLLTASVPIGLQFGGKAGSIQVQGNGQGPGAFSGPNFASTVGLWVQPGQTLALVGGDLNLDGGLLSADRVELGAMAGAGTVSLNFDGNNLRLSFPNDVARADISLSNRAAVNFGGGGGSGGGIQIQGRRVTLSDSAIMSSQTQSGPGKSLVVDASEYVFLRNSSVGLSNGSGEGQTGDLTVTAPSVEVQGGGLSNGGGGDLSIQTRRLILMEGTLTTDTGAVDKRAGNITVIAPESVELTGSSRLSSRTLSTADAGDITIDTGKLLLTALSRFGLPPTIETYTIGLFPSGTTNESNPSGEGGNLTINASESVEISGGLFRTSTYSGGAAGDLTIQTGKLIVRDGGRVLSDTSGDGPAGILTINASESVEVSGRSAAYGQLSPITSELSTSSGFSVDGSVFVGNGVGGNMKIETNQLIVQNGGRISAATLGQGNGGKIDIQAGQLTVRDGAEVSVSSRGSGNAGNLEVSARSIRLDDKALISSDTTAGQGNIFLRSQNLVLRHGSNITTNATGTATGGNISIDTDFIAASENSDITANAQEASGGRVRINAQGIFGTEFRQEQTSESDITATGGSPELSGTVEIATPDVDPSRGLVNLPAELVDASNSFAQSCPGSGRQGESEFIITGRSGLPPNPSEALSSDAIQVDWVTLNPGVENRSSPTVSTNPTAPDPDPIVEAQGWVINNKGEVVLTATAPTATPHNPWLPPVSCHTPETSS